MKLATVTTALVLACKPFDARPALRRHGRNSPEKSNDSRNAQGQHQDNLFVAQLTRTMKAIASMKPVIPSSQNTLQVHAY